MHGGIYTFDALDQPEQDLDALRKNSVEAKFRANASLEEGISGQDRIDTSYENTREFYLESSRTDHDGDPSPNDIKRHQYPHRMS